MKTRVEYGKSMYGGWYANYFDAKEGYTGIHADTKKQLFEKLDSLLESYEISRRIDN